MRAKRCLLHISEESEAMSTPYQPIYDSTFLSWGRMKRMRMPPLLGLFTPRTGRKGSTSQPKCLCVEERKRKGRQWVQCCRSAHSYVKCTKFGIFLHVFMQVYFSFLFVSCPASCLVHTAHSSSNVPSPTGRLPNGSSLVCLASWRSLSAMISQFRLKMCYRLTQWILAASFNCNRFTVTSLTFFGIFGLKSIPLSFASLN